MGIYSQMARRKSMSIAEEDAFKMVLEELTDEIISYTPHQDIEETLNWTKTVIMYNLPGGKQIRGRGVVAAYRALVEDPTKENIKLTYILGWCIEFFQACFLLADDIMDSSETRRGQACWYLVDNKNLAAINDAFLLNGIIFFILDKYFGDCDYYLELVCMFQSIFMKTSMGQCADTKYCKESKASEFTMQQYTRMVKYKTSYYTFYLSVACAMIMAKKKNKEDWNSVEGLVLEIGHMFQVQDDYLDCFGNPANTGKVGNDIAENKCSYLIIEAFKHVNDKQKKILMENYGKGKNTTKENIEKVKQVFEELQLSKRYTEYEKGLYESISEKIDKLSHRIPRQIFQETVDLIYRRNK